MTIRQAYSDIFWFTLFHEIGHLLNDDFKDRYIDYQFTNSKEEEKADVFAKNTLINKEAYQNFIITKNITYHSIKEFASTQNIIPSIVIGRIQKEKNNYQFMAKRKQKYILVLV